MMKGKILKVKQSRLNGQVKISGAKNSALRLLAASILTEKDLRISNFPSGLSDIQIHIEMLKKIGKKITVDQDNITISENNINSELIWEGRSIRNTLLIWGALLARTGKSCVPLPGGCEIGDRKYDLHQLVLERLGAKVWVENNYLMAEAPQGLKGAVIDLPFRSRGATENAIISATLAKGKTVLFNPYMRPEIADLINMINRMGGNIKVYGNESIIIEGVERLKNTEFKVMPDTLEALTYIIAAAVAAEDEVEIENIPYKFMEIPLIYLRECGVKIYRECESAIIKKSRCYPFEICTTIYPGIESDMQPLFAILGLCTNGRSSIVDFRYPKRFKYAYELKKMGADIDITNGMITIRGGLPLYGVDIKADDLRAGAALLIAGFIASGETKIHQAEQIERGYENFITKFTNIGAQLKWMQLNN